MSRPLSVTAVNQAQVDTAQSKYGGSSLLLDGNNDYLQVTGIPSSLKSGDITIEAWIRFRANSGYKNQVLYSDQAQTTFSLTLDDSGNLNNGGRFRWVFGNAFYNFDIPTNWPEGIFIHVAITRAANGAIAAYYNGDKLTGRVEFNDDNLNNTGDMFTNQLRIGQAAGDFPNPNTAAYFFDGHIDEFRISQSVRYTADFTPPTAAFVNDADTAFLLHMDGADGSTTFNDDNFVPGEVKEFNAAISSTTSIATAVDKLRQFNAALSSAFSLNSVANKIMPLAATLASVAVFTTQVGLIKTALADLEVNAAAVVSAGLIKTAQADLEVNATAVANSNVTKTAQVTITSAFTPSILAKLIRQTQIDMQVVSSLVTSVDVIKSIQGATALTSVFTIEIIAQRITIFESEINISTLLTAEMSIYTKLNVGYMVPREKRSLYIQDE